MRSLFSDGRWDVSVPLLGLVMSAGMVMVAVYQHFAVSSRNAFGMVNYIRFIVKLIRGTWQRFYECVVRFRFFGWRGLSLVRLGLVRW